MAGGYGTRLKDLTKNLPKPMVPVAGRPALEFVVDHLAEHGIKEAAMALHYLPHAITSHFGGRRGPVELSYSIAAEDLGTAGAVRRASRYVGDNPLLIVSGDVITNFDLTALIESHAAKRSLFTVGLTKVDDPSQYGVARTDNEGRITDFVEKPKDYPEKSCWVNAGIYMIDRQALEYIPDGQFFDISRNLIPRLMADGVAIHGARLDGHWFDIGTPETLRQAEAFLSTRRSRGRAARLGQRHSVGSALALATA